MFRYDIHALCPHCGAFHDILIRVQLPEYFEVRNLGDLYESKLLTPNLLITASSTICAGTGKRFPMPSPDKLILVLVTESGPANNHN